MIVAACDKPEAKPPTNIEKDDKSTNDTDIVPKGKSGSGSSGATSGESGGDGEDAAPAAYSFAFDEASYKVAFTAGTYTKAVVETNKPAGDARAITYTSSEDKIATVNDAGVVTFIKTGTVTITATKTAEAGHEKATASYELTITKMKPAGKQALADEITRAMDAHGNKVDLNYIDVSDITDMSYLFSNSKIDGYKLQTFNGDISKWDVSSVSNMQAMFSGAAAFNQPLNSWNVSSVNDMSFMFSGTAAFNQPLNNWNVSSVENMRYMFAHATAFNQNISGWASKSGRSFTHMFTGATAMQTANKPSWAP